MPVKSCPRRSVTFDHVCGLSPYPVAHPVADVFLTPTPAEVRHLAEAHWVARAVRRLSPKEWQLLTDLAGRFAPKAPRPPYGLAFLPFVPASTPKPLYLRCDWCSAVLHPLPATLVEAALAHPDQAPAGSDLRAWIGRRQGAVGFAHSPREADGLDRRSMRRPQARECRDAPADPEAMRADYQSLVEMAVKSVKAQCTVAQWAAQARAHRAADEASATTLVHKALDALLGTQLWFSCEDDELWGATGTRFSLDQALAGANPREVG